MRLQCVRTASTLQLIYAPQLKDFGQVAIAISGLVFAVIGLQALEIFVNALNDPTYDQPIPWQLFLSVAALISLALMVIFVITHGERYEFCFNRSSGKLEVLQTQYLIRTTHHDHLPLALIKAVTIEQETVTIRHSSKNRRKYGRDATEITVPRLMLTLHSGRRLPLDLSYFSATYQTTRTAPESLQMKALEALKQFLALPVAPDTR